MAEKIPTYKISIDPELSQDGEDLGMTAIAYTAQPAILTKGLAFDDVKKMIFADSLKYRLAAPALIPDMQIYRRDDEMGEYNVVFTRETILQLRDKFMASNSGMVFNLDHNSNDEAPSYILEEWIVEDPKNDRSFTEFGIELPQGSWFVISQFVDRAFFKKEIIEKDRVGYSIEGFLGLSLTNIIKNNNQKIEMEKTKDQIILELQAELARIKREKFESAELEDGSKIEISKLEVGGEVTIVDENGDAAPLMDGEHKLKDGSVIVTVDGKITEIKPAEAPKEEAAKEEKPVEEPKKEEEKMADPAPAEGNVATQEWVQSKLDELYGVIAELKTLIESEDSVEGDGEVAADKKDEAVYTSLQSFFNNFKG